MRHLHAPHDKQENILMDVFSSAEVAEPDPCLNFCSSAGAR